MWLKIGCENLAFSYFQKHLTNEVLHVDEQFRWRMEQSKRLGHFFWLPVSNLPHLLLCHTTPLCERVIFCFSINTQVIIGHSGLWLVKVPQIITTITAILIIRNPCHTRRKHNIKLDKVWTTAMIILFALFYFAHQLSTANSKLETISFYRWRADSNIWQCFLKRKHVFIISLYLNFLFKGKQMYLKSFIAARRVHIFLWTFKTEVIVQQKSQKYQSDFLYCECLP